MTAISAILPAGLASEIKDGPKGGYERRRASSILERKRSAPMQIHLVLTVIGRDRPGLVSAVSETIAAGGGNWLDARMASLSGQFAGMLLVAIEPEKADALIKSMRQLETEGLRLIIERSDEQTPVAGRSLRLELVGLDRPGIIRDISHVLAAQNVNIAELESERVSGSFSGEAMFKAKARLTLPDGLHVEELRRSLEALAHELMVDLALEDNSPLVHRG
jgi:glycine cleavage system regulatory protein